MANAFEIFGTRFAVMAASGESPALLTVQYLGGTAPLAVEFIAELSPGHWSSGVVSCSRPASIALPPLPRGSDIVFQLYDALGRELTAGKRYAYSPAREALEVGTAGGGGGAKRVAAKVAAAGLLAAALGAAVVHWWPPQAAERTGALAASAAGVAASSASPTSVSVGSVSVGSVSGIEASGVPSISVSAPPGAAMAAASSAPDAIVVPDLPTTSALGLPSSPPPKPPAARPTSSSLESRLTQAFRREGIGARVRVFANLASVTLQFDAGDAGDPSRVRQLVLQTFDEVGLKPPRIRVVMPEPVIAATANAPVTPATTPPPPPAPTPAYAETKPPQVIRPPANVAAASVAPPPRDPKQICDAREPQRGPVDITYTTRYFACMHTECCNLDGSTRPECRAYDQQHHLSCWVQVLVRPAK